MYWSKAAVIFSFFTTVVSFIIGLTLKLIMKPGQYIFALGGFPNSGKELPIPDEAPNLIENIPTAIPTSFPITH
jgi:Na+/H+-dicarboxylate symporter